MRFAHHLACAVLSFAVLPAASGQEIELVEPSDCLFQIQGCHQYVCQTAQQVWELLDSDAFWDDAGMIVGPDTQILVRSARRERNRARVTIATLEQDVREAIRGMRSLDGPYFVGPTQITCEEDGGVGSVGELDVGQQYAGSGGVCGTSTGLCVPTQESDDRTEVREFSIFQQANLRNTMAHELMHVLSGPDGLMYVTDGTRLVRERARRNNETSASYLVGATASCSFLIAEGVYRPDSLSECARSVAQSSNGEGLYTFRAHPHPELLIAPDEQ